MKTDRNKILIISAFPGMGKSYFAKEVERKRECLNEIGGDVDVIDFESSDFHWIQDAKGHKSLNPEWPENYFQAIKGIVTKAISYEKCYEDFLELKVKPTIILTSSHHEVITGLYNMAVLNPQYHIDYCVVLPTKNRLNEFIESYERRGNTPKFIELLKENWDKWINDIDKLAQYTNLKVFHLRKACIGVDLLYVQKGFISDYYLPLYQSSIKEENDAIKAMEMFDKYILGDTHGLNKINMFGRNLDDVMSIMDDKDGTDFAIHLNRYFFVDLSQINPK